MFRLDIPYRTASHTNRRGHTRALARAVKNEREIVRYAWIQAGKPVPALPAVVSFTRAAPRPLDDDNLPSAFKAMRDELVACWGFADDSHRTAIEWRYDQIKHPTYAVGILVEEGELAR